MSTSAPAWLAAALQGQRASLARAVTAVEEHTPDAAHVLQAVYPRIGRAQVVGFTGLPGAGKSTLIGLCIAEALRRGLSVGVVAVDPTSPLSGGSVLGDRIRMLSTASDSRVFVRSLAARGHLGGLSAAAAGVVDVLDAAGKDLILVESVGVGQSETEIRELVQLTVLVCAPGMGDDVQMIKAGLLEIANVFAVNKSDLPEAHGLIQMLRAAGQLADAPAPPVIATSAVTGAGVAELLDLLRARHAQAPAPDLERRRRLRYSLQARALEKAHLRLAGSQTPRLDRLCDDVLAGNLGFDEAAEALLVFR